MAQKLVPEAKNGLSKFKNVNSDDGVLTILFEISIFLAPQIFEKINLSENSQFSKSNILSVIFILLI